MTDAKLTTTIVKGHGDESTTRRIEEKMPIDLLRTNDREKSRVTQAVSSKISDALYYGKGKWDKIPYTVEVFSSVSLECDQDQDSILTAQNIAHQLAFESSYKRMQESLLGHVENMQNNLYRSMFHED